MKRSELKTGMLLEDREGRIGIVMLGTSNGDVVVGDGKRENRMWKSLKSYREHDIVKVYGFSSNMHGADFNTVGRPLLFDRNSIKISLTDEYDAVVDMQNKVVKVGCQTIPFAKVKELYGLTIG